MLNSEYIENLSEDTYKLIDNEFNKYAIKNDVICNYTPFNFVAREDNIIIGIITGHSYYYDVIQNVNFSLNEKGCNLSSKATMVTEYLGIGEDTKFCYFQDTFIIFMKENNSDRPYFALKVDNSDILEKVEETDEPKITDYTMMSDSDKYKVGERRI